MLAFGRRYGKIYISGGNMNTQDITTGYNNIKKIIDYLIDCHNITFESSQDAPSTYNEMVAYYNKNGKFLVYNGGDTANYLGHEYNLKFRALHDFMHYFYRLKFTFTDEKTLSDITANQFYLIGLDMGLDIRNCLIIKAIINAEIKGQIEYYELNKTYVPNQTEFIDNYLKAS
jgi:hypothetical protein